MGENDPMKSWADYSSSGTDDDGNAEGEFEMTTVDSLIRNARNSYKKNDKKFLRKVQKNNMAHNKNKSTISINTTGKLGQFHVKNARDGDYNNQKFDANKNEKTKSAEKMQTPNNDKANKFTGNNKQKLHSNDNQNKKERVLMANKPAEKKKTPYSDKNSNKNYGSKVPLRGSKIAPSAGEGNQRNKDKTSGADKSFSFSEISYALARNSYKRNDKKFLRKVQKNNMAHNKNKSTISINATGKLG